MTIWAKRALILLLCLFLSAGISFSEEISSPEADEGTLLGTSEFTLPSFLDFKEPPIKESAPPRVETLVTSLEVKGNIKVGLDKVMEAVFTKVGEPLIEEKVNADVKAIYGMGYFSDVQAQTTPYKNGSKVTFIISENPFIKFITFEGNSAISTEVLVASMESKAGDILSYAKLRGDMQRIDSLYHNSGYMLARVVDVGNDEAGGLKIKMIEGLVEGISIEGNESTQRYVILRELNTKKGRALNEKVLSKDLRRVFNLGFFSEVNPAFEPGLSPDKIKLVVRVKEQRTNTINLGGGYGEREGWFGFVDLSINNLFGTGQALMIRGQSGTQLQTYQFKYYNPWVLEEYFGDHLGFTFKRWYTIGTDFYFAGQNEIHNGWSTMFTKPFAEVWSASIGYGGEWVGPYRDSSFEAYDANTVDLSLSYDTRDFWMNPTEGMFHTISTRWGWKYTSKTTQFMKYGLDLNFFVPLAERQVLALHGGSGFAVGDVPVGELYWVGGANTVRGYYPSDSVTGTKKLLFNAEYRYTFNEIVQGVVFLDYGYAWDTGAPQFPQFLSGKGLGVRLNTPLGPIRLDWGIASGKNFADGILHFSIGQAF